MISDVEREAVLLSIAVLAEELNRKVLELRSFVAMLQAIDGRGVPTNGR